MKAFIFYSALVAISTVMLTACSTYQTPQSNQAEAQQENLRIGKNLDLDKKIEDIATKFNIPAVHVQIHERGQLSYQKFLNNQLEDLAYYEPYYLKDFLFVKSTKSV
jgi:tRNA threonylcarbamoyladenosine biosynthesis protein TsaB